MRAQTERRKKNEEAKRNHLTRSQQQEAKTLIRIGLARDGFFYLICVYVHVKDCFETRKSQLKIWVSFANSIPLLLCEFEKPSNITSCFATQLWFLRFSCYSRIAVFFFTPFSVVTLYRIVYFGRTLLSTRNIHVLHWNGKTLPLFYFSLCSYGSYFHNIFTPCEWCIHVFYLCSNQTRSEKEREKKQHKDRLEIRCYV